ncbi:MAG: hypothetical protein AAFR96_11515 [Planctomycetota bacterium]
MTPPRHRSAPLSQRASDRREVFRALTLAASAAAFVAPAVTAAQIQTGLPPVRSPQPDGAEADQDSIRPDASRRTVAFYDFEEPTNPFEVPGDFFRAQSDPSAGIDRPGYPVFNRAGFDAAHATSGERAVRLPIQRGSVALRLRPGALPVFPDADYTIACNVRGEGLTHARFRLVARLLDQNAEPIEGAEFASDPILPEDAWDTVRIQVPGGISTRSAFLQIDTELVQPEQYQDPVLGQHQVFPEDYSGQAWVDDLIVNQLPRIWVGSQTPGGVIAEPEAPALTFLVRDLTGDRLTARLSVHDLQARTVFQDERPVASSAEPKTWPISLDRFGWYSATIEIVAGDAPVGRASCAIAYVPPSPIRTDAQGGFSDRTTPVRFAFAVDRPGPALLEAVPAIARDAATPGIAVGAWPESLTPESAPAAAEALLDLLGSTTHQWGSPVIALQAVPEQLQQQLVIDPRHVTRALASPRDVWASHLDPLLDRLGQIASRWRLGPIVPEPEFRIAPAPLAAIRSEIAQLVPGPRIGIAAMPHLELPTWQAGALDDLTVTLGAGTGPEAGADVVERFAASSLFPSTSLTLAYDTNHNDRFAQGEIVSELVKRIVLAEAAAARTAADAPDENAAPDQGNADEPIALTHQLIDPWHVSARDNIISPSPALAAWRSVTDRLRGRSVAAELATTPGVRAFLLIPEDPDDPRGGGLVAWNESAPTPDAIIRTNLGARPVTTLDLFGNLTGTVEPVEQEIAGGIPISLHQFPVGRTPIFLEGIEVELALFVASIRIDEPVIQTTLGPHPREILITNPWRVAIDGDVIILQPAERLDTGRRTGWDISPRVARFSAGPGQTARVPIDLAFSPVELAGIKPFVVDVAIRSGPIQERLRAPSTIELLLDGIELDARHVVDPTGQNIAIEAVVTNTAAEPVDLTLHVAARGFPRQTSSITQLPPGAASVRRFMYPEGVERLTGARVFVGVEDPARRARLNKAVDVN